LTDLARVGAEGLDGAAVSSEVIIIDEVGPMELVSPEFRRAVRNCIDSAKPILAVVHERLDDDLLNELRSKAAKAFSMTIENREAVTEELAATVLEAAGGPKVQ
jgi:nucleoside-triphosphatase